MVQLDVRGGPGRSRAKTQENRPQNLLPDCLQVPRGCWRIVDPGSWAQKKTSTTRLGLSLAASPELEGGLAGSFRRGPRFRRGLPPSPLLVGSPLLGLLLAVLAVRAELAVEEEGVVSDWSELNFTTWPVFSAGSLMPTASSTETEGPANNVFKRTEPARFLKVAWFLKGRRLRDHDHDYDHDRDRDHDHDPPRPPWRRPPSTSTERRPVFRGRPFARVFCADSRAGASSTFVLLDVSPA